MRRESRTKPGLAFGILCVLAGSLHAAPYTLIDLGDIPGGQDFSWAQDINNAGQVAGFSEGASDWRAFRWNSTAGMQDLGTLPGGDDFSWAWGINDAGQVVGGSGWANEQAFLWESGRGMQGLGALPGTSASRALGIDSNGQVVGWSGERAFVWDGVNGMRDLNTVLDAGSSGWTLESANAINDHGWIIGTGRTATGVQSFLYDTLHGIQSLSISANAINENGYVVGSDGQHAFLWDSMSGTHDLGDLPGGDDVSWANAINDAGQVVGAGTTAVGQRAFLWDSVNGMRDLNALLDAGGEGWTLTEAWAVNDRGWIVGVGENPGGAGHAFLLVPEPASLIMMAVGLGGLARRRQLVLFTERPAQERKKPWDENHI
ncbi:MAG: PEP-CTERM sorting domain-containing protein [Phycisphaerae bacterium]|nr:PEP-CTERM sorting domain-containing protein [Phycisphaerae bacterium]